MLQANSPLRLRFPLGLCALVLGLALVGILNIASASQDTRSPLFMLQIVWFVVGIAIAAIISFVQTRTLYRAAYPFYILSITLLFLVLLVGTTVKGSQRWIELGLFRLQPSELVKVAVVLALSRFCADLGTPGPYRLRDLIRPFNISRPFLFICAAIFLVSSNRGREKLGFFATSTSSMTLVFVLLCLIFCVIWFGYAVLQIRREGWTLYQALSFSDLVLLPFVLILIQPDLGTAMIVLLISAAVILFCGLRLSSLVIAVIAALAVAVLSWNIILKDYQRQRIQSFLAPEQDIRGQGYHAAQSIIAIGSGQFLGKGFGEGTQTQLSFLPENHTDFVFSVLGEEWGFLGAITVMLAFMTLILLMIRIGSRTHERFASLLAVGSASLVFWHVIINTGMVTGILPIVGVTLPFVSYGGASMVTQMAAIGLCVNVAVWRRTR